MSIANPLYSSLEEGPNGSSAGATSASAAAAAAQAAALRDRLKKSTMACEMCRKRKVLSFRFTVSVRIANAVYCR